jgi:GDPmannose 4,6-dehydratase
MKKIIITGVTGQDGSLMADYLLANTDIDIIAGVRRLSVENHRNIKHLKNNPRFKLIDLDITDSQNVEDVIRKEQPDYFINFAANSFVGSSWTMPFNHMNTNCMAVLYQLEAVRKFAPHCRYYNAGSSEEFGDVVTAPQSEEHPLRPRSPYGASKAAARHLVKVYRDSYGIYAVQGWLFNHEGVRRGEEFVTRKITQNVARIKRAIKNKLPFEPLKLGNLEAKRDWSDAEDFMDGVWKMLNQDANHLKGDFEDFNFSYQHNGQNDRSPQRESEWLSKKIKEYVLSSNETHTIKEFVELAFLAAGIEGIWVGEGLEALYLLPSHSLDFVQPPTTKLVEIDERFYRLAEVELLLGDSTKARQELGWTPKTSFKNLIDKMVKNDILLLDGEK